MSNIIDWKKVKYFTVNEKWGDYTKIVPEALYTLDAFRDYVKRPIIIHCAYEESGHTSKSQHYLGRAFDFHIKGLNWRDQYYAAVEFGKWSGIGVYPDWNNPGLHCDIRILNPGQKVAKWTRWKGLYIGTDEETFNNIAQLKGEPIR